jgi:hypothetical protein
MNENEKLYTDKQVNSLFKKIDELYDEKINIDELLIQEIYSLREKLKIAVEAIKSYDPEFDEIIFYGRLNNVDFDQLMEELNEIGK